MPFVERREEICVYTKIIDFLVRFFMKEKKMKEAKNKKKTWEYKNREKEKGKERKINQIECSSK